MKDILIFMSDQHAGFLSGYAGDPIVRTPALDKLARDGTVMENAYTSCPLCVPARMSMLSGQMPSLNGVLDNGGSIPPEQPTFLHALGIAGYETVLCGRMHFDGPDQRHGFSKRIMGELTPVWPGYRKNIMKERQLYAMTFAEPGALKIIGGGNSPVLEYDRAVTEAALAYLSQPHERPQCIVVGTYAPHFPYVAPPELYSYYDSRVELPRSMSHACDYDYPPYRGRHWDETPETVHAVRAAYWAMTEFMDSLIGRVREKWQEYLKMNGREGVFVYLSDHGDSCGTRGMYGKTSFFEPSVHIPMIFEGEGIPAGRKLSGPVSIMDIGPTLCEMAGAELPPRQQGISLWPAITGKESQDTQRVVLSDASMIENVEGKKVPGRMAVADGFKYITYAGYEKDDLLFDLRNDPDELHNCILEYPEIARSLSDAVHKGWEPQKILASWKQRSEGLAMVTRWTMEQDMDESERWKTTDASRDYPEKVYSSPVQLPAREGIMARMFAGMPEGSTDIAGLIRKIKQQEKGD